MRSSAACGQQRTVVGRTAAMPKARRHQLAGMVADRNVVFQDVAELSGLCNRLAGELA